MEEKVLRAKYPPHKAGNQQEFDTWMSQLNEVQSNDNIPFNKQKAEIRKQRDIIRLQMQNLRQQDHLLKMQYMEIEDRQRDNNRVYYTLKHEMLTLNPKNAAITQ